jgi:signal transduction histidine kinase/ActR/RegA family two-component response regulator
MSIEPEVIRSESHQEIGYLLQRDVTLIIERWSRRAVEEQPLAARVHHAVLLDHLREVLATLGRSLAASEEPDTGGHCLTATVHGEQRWETGWSLLEVVRDYQILRLVVMEYLEETLDRPLGSREVMAIGLALDEAIAASVTMYVKGRDQYLRQLEEERTKEIQQNQERLQAHAASLLEADRRKNEFLAVLAHELRNPLAPIRNATELLRLQASQDAKVQWARELIDRQIQQLTHLVDDLLDVSRIARGKIRLQKEKVALTSIVEHTLEMTQPLIDSNKHRLIVSMPAQLVCLEADAARVTQVLVNLISNAVKYSPQGGSIWLTVLVENSEVVIRVRDAGMGISPELLPHVFDMFVQEERSSEQAPGGLGIGLSLVKSIVELHDGRVEAFSDGPGQGSEFVVHLALAETPAGSESTPLAASLPQVTAAQRILIVDDNADSANSLAGLLRILGHKVWTANEGMTALQAARLHLPGFVLLDIGLPGMNGLEIARRMRQDNDLRETMIVAVTGYAHDDDKRRSQEAGCNAHLVKPVNLNELKELLNRSPGQKPSECSGQKTAGELEQ